MNIYSQNICKKPYNQYGKEKRNLGKKGPLTQTPSGAERVRVKAALNTIPWPNDP